MSGWETEPDRHLPRFLSQHMTSTGVQRFIIAPPSSPGSKGDEGMVRGLLEVLKNDPIVLLNPEHQPRWTESLDEAAERQYSFEEVIGCFSESKQRIKNNDAVFILGADVIDGTCGLEPSMQRLELAEFALGRGAQVLVFCSFRSNVDERILEMIHRCRDAHFYMRDPLSSFNFKSQTGLAAGTMADFFIFCQPLASPRLNAIKDMIRTEKENGRSIVGVNFCEHAFRSFHDCHDDVNRTSYVENVLDILKFHLPNSFLIVISNDTREWENFPSDTTYQGYAQEWARKNGMIDQILVLPSFFSYCEILCLLEDVRFIITGRMHLALASFRAGSIPIILMGKGRGYSSIDKMKGAFAKYIGDGKLVCKDTNTLSRAITIATDQEDSLKGKIRDSTSRITLRAERDIREVVDMVKAPQARRLPYWKAIEALGGSDQGVAVSPGIVSDLVKSIKIQTEAGELGSHESSSGMVRSDQESKTIDHLDLDTPTQNNMMPTTNEPNDTGSSLRNQRSWDSAEWEKEVSRLSHKLGEREELVKILGRVIEDLNLQLKTVAERLGENDKETYDAKMALRKSLQDQDYASRKITSLMSEIECLRKGLSESRGNFARTLHNVSHTIDKIIAVDRQRKFQPEQYQLIKSLGNKNIGKDRILVADYRIPRADVSAGERATYGIIRDLRDLGFEVLMLPKDLEPNPKYERRLNKIGVEVVTREWGFRSATEFLDRHAHMYPIFYIFRADIAETLIPIYRTKVPKGKIVFHAPDLAYLRQEREALLTADKVALDAALATKAKDLDMMRMADHVVTVSQVEAEVLKEELPDTKISVVPALYAPVIKEVKAFEERKHLFFLGGFAHLPNISAVNWLVHEVWPIAKELLPEGELYILGSDIPDTISDLSNLERVNIVGVVENLEPVLSLFRVGLAPLLYGAGIKGKVATSLGLGIPCVCTTVAAEGMGIIHNQDALVVNEDPKQFAEAIQRLYSDKETWSRLSQRGQDLVDLNFGNIANRNALTSLLYEADILPISKYIDCFTKPVELSERIRERLSRQVDVSIMIWDDCNSNDSSEIVKCINSLAWESSRSVKPMEVIVISRTLSAPEIESLGSSLVSVTSIDFDVDSGLVSSLNTAIDESSGTTIVVLNASLIALPGSLSNLARFIKEDRNIGIAGSKIITREGFIVEAGMGICQDGSLLNLGRHGLTSNKSLLAGKSEEAYSFPREVDSFSGVCVAFTRSLWEQCGCLEVNYETLPYAFADLAMACRGLGKIVAYCPESEIICLRPDAITSNLLTNERMNGSDDKDKFCKKWNNILESDHLPRETGSYKVAARAERTVPYDQIKRRNQKSLNILYFSPFPSHPSNHGNQATIKQFGQRFQAMGHSVHFVLLDNNLFSPEDEQEMRDSWDSFTILPNSKHLGSDGFSIPFDGWYEEGLGESIRLICYRQKIDIVFCSYIFHSKLLDFVPNHILKVIDTHDKMGERYEMLKKNGQPLEFFSCSCEEEGRYLARADVVCARRKEEAEYFNKVSGRESSIVVPHFEDSRFIDREYTRLDKVGVVASANRINLAIIREFLQAIADYTGDNNPPFRVCIAGQVKNLVRSLPDDEADLFFKDWVDMRGFIPSIEDFYREMDLIVSPVTMGTGINVKTVQALAFGMPLVTTAWGSKGINSTHANHSHNDLLSLVQSLFQISRKSGKLNRLASQSRDIYQLFLKDAHAGLHRVIQLSLRKAWTFSTSRSDLKDRIEFLYQSFFVRGDRSSCMHIDDEYSASFDGRDTASSIRKLIEEPTIHDEDFKLISPFASEDSIFFDIGANWGYSATSIWAVLPNQRVVSFEPIKTYEKVLQVIKDMCETKFDYRMIALGDETKTARFVVPVINGIALSALASARSPAQSQISGLANNVYNYIKQWMPNTSTVELAMLEFDAPMKKLDDIVKADPGITGQRRISFIKIDAEGYEPQVLYGARLVLDEHKPAIMLEGGCRYEGLPGYMEELGYRYAERDGSVFSSHIDRSTSPNGFFIHSNDIPRLESLSCWKE